MMFEKNELKKREARGNDMKKQTQEQRIVSMMKRPIPKRKVSIIKLQMVREGEALYGTKRCRNAREAAEMVRPLFE